MFVLAKQKDQHQTFALLYDWPVSTGREEPTLAPSGKILATNTPQGVFQLDRDRFHADYTSNQWQSPMPYAMFFDWRIEGRTSGLAIHGTDDAGAKDLGKRASHGCIRLSPENARILFELIQANYRGRVPRFQVNPDSGTMSTTGALVRDENGTVKMTQGYKVLVFIEDFGGPSVDTVAALY
ncbi:MAG: L,D-transpeptidase [Alphaproteobacteria bacterium]|nr:L,D-transpeptidase [Alphaproteobacteria bacterium]